MYAALVRFRVPIAVALCAVVATAALGIARAVVPDNSITAWFLPDDPAVQSYERFHEHFGNDEVILIQVHDSKGVLTRDVLSRLQKLTHALENIDGIARVHSIVTVEDAIDTPEGIRFERRFSDPLPDDAGLMQAAAAARNSVLFRDRLLSSSGTRTLLWVEMAVSDRVDDERGRIVQQVRAQSDLILAGLEHPMAGFGVTYAGIDELTKRDFGLFLGLCYAVMVAFLAWVFRERRFVVATLGVMLLSSVAALGSLGLAGHRINMVTSVLPTLILVLGIADAIHMPAAFMLEERARPDASRFEIAVAALRRVALPCLLTSATTMAGFASLAVSKMAVMSQLGLFAAIGMAAALLLTLSLMTVAYMSGARAPATAAQSWLSALLDAAHAFVTRRTAWAAGVLLTLSGLAVWGALRVEADTYSLGYLPEDSRIVTEHEQIVDGWGHYSPLDYTIVPKEGRRVDSPELLSKVAEFVREASQLEQVHYGFAAHDFHRAVAQAFGADVRADEPLAGDVMAQVGLLLEGQAQDLEWDQTKPAYFDNFLAPFRTRDADLGRVTLVVDMMSARGFAELLAKLEPIAERTLGEYAALSPSGYLPLYISVIDHVISAQVQSFFMALGIIFAIMLIWTRSLRLSLISLVPNVFPVLVMLGVMGAFGIDLDIATATVAAIVFGVAIDNTIHFMHHYREGKRQGLPWADALAHSYRSAGHPALITACSLLIGYPVLMFAAVKPVFYFGLLTTLATIAALVGDLLLLPLLLRFFDRTPSLAPSSRATTAEVALADGLSSRR
jgi:predicted RND superfamily exporter protein